MKKLSFGFHVERLAKELETRQKNNSDYSLRAFARDLSLDSSALSAILKGKRGLTEKQADYVAWKLELMGEERQKFFESVAKGKVTLGKVKSTWGHPYVVDTSQDLQARIMADWKNMAIFTLLATVDQPVQADWIAERLEFELDIVEDLVKDLLTAKLIVEKEGGFVKIDGPIHSSADTGLEAYINTCRNKLSLSEEKLEDYSPDVMDFSSICFSADSEKFLQAKELVSEFRRKLSSFMREGENSEVYQMNIQLFPLTKKTNL